MRRSTLVLAIVLGAAAIDVAACNTISGVGDYSFASASSTTGGAGGPTTTTTTDGTAGSTASGGGGGASPAIDVPCVEEACPVVPGKKACCYDRGVFHPEESGRCISSESANDCDTDPDAGRESLIECSRPEDCPADEICCGTLASAVKPDGGVDSFFEKIVCQEKCGFAPEHTVCVPDGGACTKSEDGGPRTCEDSVYAPKGYYVCK